MAKGRGWYSPTYTSHADKLKYDALYREWWAITEFSRHLEVPNMSQQLNTNQKIDHGNRDMDKIGRLWQNTSKSGQVYLRGFLDDGRQVLIFNHPQTNPNAPTWSINISRYTDEERQILAAQEAAKQAEFQQQQAPQQAQPNPLQPQPVQQQQPLQQPVQQPVQQQPVQQAAPVDNLPL